MGGCKGPRTLKLGATPSYQRSFLPSNRINIPSIFMFGRKSTARRSSPRPQPGGGDSEGPPGKLCREKLLKAVAHMTLTCTYKTNPCTRCLAIVKTSWETSYITTATVPRWGCTRAPGRLCGTPSLCTTHRQNELALRNVHPIMPGCLYSARIN
jgi:hypothetical protein